LIQTAGCRLNVFAYACWICDLIDFGMNEIVLI
jgi:hypothetical protein